VTSPIDGRVADINRRLGSAYTRIDDVYARIDDVYARIDQVAGELTHYARASSEATSYVGDEVRRLEDVVTEMREDYYRERLEWARRSGLDALDGDLAALLNTAAGHEGFAAQAKLWFNPPLTVEFGAGDAQIGDVNERIVEVPFAMAALGRVAPGARVLDIGSAESTFPLSAASLGYRVDAIDLTPLPYSHPNLTSFAGRFEDWEAPDQPFSGAFLISTIEHVGLGAYGEDPYGSTKPGAGADRAMIERIRGLLTPDGVLIVTTPFGSQAVSQFQRTYDAEALNRLLEGWEILEQRTIVQRDRQVWLPGENPDGDAPRVAMVIATPRDS
jgi:hypothetical protein